MSSVLNPDPFRPVLLNSPDLLVTPEQDQNIKEILDICCSDSKFAEKAYEALKLTLVPDDVVPPVVSSLNPSTAIINSPVSLIVSGTGFVLDSVISFGGVDVATTFTSETELSALVTTPGTEGPVPVTVTSGQVVSDPVDFTVTPVVLLSTKKSIEVKDRKEK